MSDQPRTLAFDVEGMTCDSCVSHVETRLATVEDSGEEAGWAPSGDPTRYDVAVVGGGSAGFAAAIRAVEKGARVVMVNEGTIGGTCVNVGCVPSKTLIRAAEARHTGFAHNFDGVGRSEASIDWPLIRENKNALVTALRTAKYEDILAAYDGITLLEGRAVLGVDGALTLTDGTPVPAAKVILTMGSSPWAPSVPGLKESGYLDSEALLDVDALPASLAVIGGGSVGVELAQAYSRLGVEVTVLARSRLLSGEDPDIGEELARHLRDEGISVLTDVVFDRVERSEMGRTLHFSTDGTPETIDVAEILVAAGRRPNTEGMGLAEAGVKLGAMGEVIVDAGLRTSHPDVFAAGDVTGGPMHVYVAARAASVAAENALGGSETLDLTVLPVVTFTDPGVASVGLTEAAAREAGLDPIVSKLALEHVPRALAARDTRGFIKLVADTKTRRIVGAHIVSPEAGEMIMEPALAVRFGLTIEDLTSTLHPYLTSSEGIKLAALTFDKDVAMLSCCAV